MCERVWCVICVCVRVCMMSVCVFVRVFVYDVCVCERVCMMYVCV